MYLYIYLFIGLLVYQHSPFHFYSHFITLLKHPIPLPLSVTPSHQHRVDALEKDPLNQGVFNTLEIQEYLT